MVVRLLRTAFPVILLFMAGSACAEGVHKWVDAQGRVHFGDTPPAGQKTERINVSAPPVQAEPTQARDWQEQLQLSNQRRQLEREKEQVAAKRQRENDQRCIAARNVVDSLERGGARYRINAQGEREYLDDNQRQATRDAARQRVAAYCQN
jgi:hypothetical protein